MQSSSAKRASIALGILMAVVMIAGIFVPLFQQTVSQNAPQTAPTDTVLPTFPPPPADFSTIKFDKVYLHPSGIYSIAEPDGWSASQPNRGVTIAQINLINNDMLSVVDSYIEAPGFPITPDQLSDHFSQAVIAASWSNFSTWQESSRSMQNDHLIIDFTVTLSGRTYVARQNVWTDGAWIYVVRVLVPENATDLLLYLLNNFTTSMKAQTEFKGTPLDWSAYYDPTASHIIRYPSGWTVTDSAPGRPTSITSADGTVLRVEAHANTSVADEAAARTYVQGELSSVTVTSVQPVTRLLGQGFSVAYSFTTVDGSKESGLTVLLNDAGGTLHVADLRFPQANVDLNSIGLGAQATAEATSAATAEATAPAVDTTYINLAQVMSTFYVITPLNLSAQSLPATATPLPTIAPTAFPTSATTLDLTFAPPTATGASTEAATPSALATEQVTEQATAEATTAP